MDVTATKVYRISAAHLLPGHPVCGRLHGHNYKVELSIRGPLDAQGMILDFSEMKEHLDMVVGRHDHARATFGRALHEVFEWPTTAENLASHWLSLLHDLDERYFKLRVWETDDSYAEASVD